MANNGASRDVPARLELLGRLDLRDGAGAEVTSILKGPKRIALLAWLVLARKDWFHRRDPMLALFWPESGAEQARGSLRQAIHTLRRSLGAAAIESRGDEELRINPACITCDAVEFERLAAEGRAAEALRLYRGPLLDGFHVSDVAQEFDSWLAGERARLARLAGETAWRLADQAEREGAWLDAATWARQALSLLPQDEPSVRRLMQLLGRLGDRAGALRVFEEFAVRLRTEFESEPAAETRELAAHLRTSPPASPVPAVTAAPVTEGTAAAAADAPQRPAPSPRARRLLVGGGMLLTALLATGLWMRLRAAAPVPVLAVGVIGEPSVPDTTETARAIPELLATSLARLPDVKVVSRIRLYDVMGQLGDSVLTPELTARVARRAGATELVEGTFYRTGGDSFRLDLRRVDLETGTVRGAYTVGGTSVFQLADAATRALAADLHVALPETSPAAAVSLAARRLFEEGLRRYYTGSTHEAAELFESALSEDSTYALAAYYAAESRQEDPPTALALLRQAVRLSPGATPRDRLTILLAWAIRTNDTAMVAVADSLSRRYPDDAETRYAAGQAHAWTGDPAGAMPHFRRVITLDSAGLRGAVVRCRACDAYTGLAAAYMQLDSLAAAERALQELMRARPGLAPGWALLARVLAQDGREREALEALGRSGRSLQEPAGLALGAEIQLILDHPDEAEAQLIALTRFGSRDIRREGLWLLNLAQRHRGQLRDALATAARLAALCDSLPGGARVNTDGRLLAAQTYLELGETDRAIAGYEALAAIPPTDGAEITGILARKRAFDLARLAMALSAAHDTVRLVPLADSVASWSRRSAFSRDRALAPYAAGLVARERGQLDSAARAFRAALVLPGSGLSRVNVDLAATLLALGRPAEAIAPLQVLFRRDVQGSNLYVTRGEAHLLLAEAFAKVGRADSAAFHYEAADRLWRDGDPAVRGRLAALRARGVESQ